MNKITYWAARTLWLIGQLPAALALASFIVVWAKIGNIGTAAAGALLVALSLAVVLNLVMKYSSRTTAKAATKDNISSGSN